MGENYLVVRHQSLQKLVLSRVDLVSGCLGAPRTEGRQSQAGCLPASLVGQHMASKWTPGCSGDHQWLHVPLERILSVPAQNQMRDQCQGPRTEGSLASSHEEAWARGPLRVSGES